MSAGAGPIRQRFAASSLVIWHSAAAKLRKSFIAGISRVHGRTRRRVDSKLAELHGNDLTGSDRVRSDARTHYFSFVGGELPGELGLTLPNLSALRAAVSIARCSASDLQIRLYRWLPISRTLRHC